MRMRADNVVSARRYCLAMTLVAAGCFTVTMSLAKERTSSAMTDTNRILAYVGTYTEGRKSEGIYVFEFNPETGALTHISKAATGIKNPSFLALDPTGRFLFSVNELSDLNGKKTGGVSAFAIDRKTGGLTLLNQQPSMGTGPCHLSVDRAGRYLFVANYGSGSAAMLPIGRDGRLGEATGFSQHSGSSVNKQRQEGPHAHSITLDSGNRRAFVADLGLDKVMIYRLDLQSGKLLPNSDPSAKVHEGAGPRHFDFHPNGKYAYLINELDSTMTAFAYDAGTGTLRELQSLSTLPEGFTGTSHCADVHVAPDGKFLYGSNRGHDSIVIYKIDQATGRLALVGHESTRGRIPRNFGIDPTGSFLFAANQETDDIVQLRIDRETGRLTPTGQLVVVPTPVCVKFLVLPAGS